jgi:hypothetical protein
LLTADAREDLEAEAIEMERRRPSDIHSMCR